MLADHPAGLAPQIPESFRDLHTPVRVLNARWGVRAATTAMRTDIIKESAQRACLLSGKETGMAHQH
jgi:hypothetical protein